MNVRHAIIRGLNTETTCRRLINDYPQDQNKTATLTQAKDLRLQRDTNGLLYHTHPLGGSS